VAGLCLDPPGELTALPIAGFGEGCVALGREEERKRNERG